MNRDARSKTTALGNYIMEIIDEIVSLKELFHAFPQHINFKSVSLLSRSIKTLFKNRKKKIEQKDLGDFRVAWYIELVRRHLHGF